MFHLYFVFDKPYFTNTSLISGTLHIKTHETFNLEHITLILSKFTTNSLLSTTKTHTFDLYKIDALKVPAGHHTYPFKFYLKNTDGATINETVLFDGRSLHLQNSYTLRGEVKIFGAYLPIINTESEIYIVEENNLLQREIKVEATSCLCLYKRYFKLYSNIDRINIFLNEEINLLLECEKRILSVDIFIFEIVSIGTVDVNVKYRLVMEKNFEFDEYKVQCPIMIKGMANSVCEEVFEVRHLMQVVVRFKGGVEIRYKEELSVIERRYEKKINVNMDVMRGITASAKYLVLDNWS